jgi:hypothetical protein
MGNQIEMTYYDETSKPARSKGGYTGWTAKHDDLSRIIEQAYFGYDRSAFGYVKCTMHYEGDHSYFELFDEADHPLNAGPRLIEISEVSPNSLGERIGLQVGDVIWSYDKWLFFDGMKTLYPDWDEATKALINDVTSPGDSLRKLVVIRHGRPIRFETLPGRLGIVLISQFVAQDWFTGALHEVSASPP